MLSFLQEPGRQTRVLVPGEHARALVRPLAKVPGVAYDTARGALLLPAEPRLVEYAAQESGAALAPDVRTCLESIVAEELERAALLERDDAALPHPQAARLFPYQRVGAAFLARVGRAILADEPGLGKTAQTVVAIEATRRHERVLVVCPNSLKHWWRAEMCAWSAGAPEVTVCEAKARATVRAYRTGWLVANYELVRVEPAFRAVYWDWLVLDEAHRAKNRQTQTFKALKALRYRRIALLTGTPYGNDPSELWALLHLMDPARYSSFWRFYELYVDYALEWGGGRTVLGVRNPHLLRRELASRMVRREKAVVYPQIPEKIYQTVPLTLHPKQEKHYLQLAREGLVRLEETGEVITVESALTELLRLRQIVSTPATLGLPDDSAKLDAVLDLIQDTDERVLVFTLFRPTVACLARRLEAAKIPHATIHGGVDLAGREEAARRLNAGEARVLVGTLQAAGVGLNLPGASTVIFVDKHYNPEKQQQAEDRAHRVTSTRRVRVVSLLCAGTVDTVVERILARKLSMQQAVLGQALLEELRAELAARASGACGSWTAPGTGGR